MKTVSIIFLVMLSALCNFELQAQIPTKAPPGGYITKIPTSEGIVTVVTTPRGGNPVLDLLSEKYTSKKFVIQDSTSVSYLVSFKLEEHKADSLNSFDIVGALGNGRMPFELMTDRKEDESLLVVVYTQSASSGRPVFPLKGHRLKWRTLEALDISKRDIVPVLLIYSEKIEENIIEKKIDKLFQNSKINSAPKEEIEKRIRSITSDFSFITYKKYPR